MPGRGSRARHRADHRNEPAGDGLVDARSNLAHGAPCRLTPRGILTVTGGGKTHAAGSPTAPQFRSDYHCPGLEVGCQPQ